MNWRAIMGAENAPAFPSHNPHNPQYSGAPGHSAYCADIAEGSPGSTEATASPLSDHARAMADRAQRAAAVHADRSGWDAEDWQAEHTERAAVASSKAGPVPLEWREGFASLQVAQMPRGFDRATWAQVIDDGGRFLDAWGPQAAALGWTGREVFGVDPGAPINRDENKGLVMLLQGRPVVALTADSCTIETRPGNTLRIFRNVGPGSVALWELEGAHGGA